MNASARWYAAGRVACLLATALAWPIAVAAQIVPPGYEVPAEDEPRSPSLAKLAALVEDDEPLVRRWAAYAVAYVRGEGSPGVSLNVGVSLIEPRTPSVAERMTDWAAIHGFDVVSRLVDRDPLSREAAVLMVARSCNRRVLDVLIDGQADPVAPVRRAVAAVLGACRHHHGAAALDRLAADVSPDVRLAAIVALGSIGRQQGLPTVEGALDDRDPAVRMYAIVSLMKLEMARRRELGDRSRR